MKFREKSPTDEMSLIDPSTPRLPAPRTSQGERSHRNKQQNFPRATSHAPSVATTSPPRLSNHPMSQKSDRTGKSGLAPRR